MWVAMRPAMHRRRTELARIVSLLAFGLTACSNASSPTDAGPPTRDCDASDCPSRPTDSGALDASTTPPACRASDPTLPLAGIPEEVLVLRHTSSPCSTNETELLVQNTSTSPLILDRVETSSATFLLEPLELPVTLLPGSTMPVGVRLSEEARGEQTGALRLSGPGGCSELPLRGIAADEAMLTLNRQALDFGVVEAGTTSETRDIVVLAQHAGDATSPTVDGVSASPESFQIVSAPSIPFALGSCAPVTVSVSFDAPETTGPVTGDLLLELARDGFAVFVAVPLRATVE